MQRLYEDLGCFFYQPTNKLMFLVPEDSRKVLLVFVFSLSCLGARPVGSRLGVPSCLALEGVNPAAARLGQPVIPDKS